MIEGISGFLQSNLLVLLAVVLVPMKLGILRLCGDAEAQKDALLSIPEDLVYVSLGLVLGDFATSGGAFRHLFASSQHVTMNLAVTVMIGVFVAIAVHLLSKWTNDHVRGWRAASNVRLRSGAANPLQGELQLGSVDTNVRVVQVRHIALASMLYLIQFVITIRWLAWIAGVLASA